MIRRILAVLARPAPAARPPVDDTATDLPACRPDPSPEQLAHVQGLCPQWLVMWCWYRREYAAIAKFSDKPTIIYDCDPRQLVYQCRAAELEQIGAPA